MEEITSARAHMAQAREKAPFVPAMTEAEREAEIKRRQAVMTELAEETERLGLYNDLSESMLP